MAKRKRTTPSKGTKKYSPYPTAKLGQTLVSLRSPVPDAFVTRLTYVGRDTLSPGAGGMDTCVVRANGMYDPDQSGVGHQPLGFDQFMALYNHWTVYSSKITVWFANLSSTASHSALVGIKLDDDTTINGDPSTVAEHDGCVYRFIGNSNNAPAALTLSFSGAKWFGDRMKLSADPFMGDSTADPTEQAFFHIFCSGTNTTVDIGNVDIYYTITYHAKFIEPKTLSAS